MYLQPSYPWSSFWISQTKVVIIFTWLPNISTVCMHSLHVGFSPVVLLAIPFVHFISIPFSFLISSLFALDPISSPSILFSAVSSPSLHFSSPSTPFIHFSSHSITFSLPFLTLCPFSLPLPCLSIHFSSLLPSSPTSLVFDLADEVVLVCACGISPLIFVAGGQLQTVHCGSCVWLSRRPP